MIDLIEVIRSATALDATAEARAAGAQACRAILASLEPQPSTEAMPTPSIPTAAPVDPAVDPAIAQLAHLASGLRGVPMEQLLDLAIARLRNALPKDAPMPTVEGVRFQLVPVAPHLKRSGS